jgi:hypothetical protein
VKLLHQLCFHSNQWNSRTMQTNVTKSYILKFAEVHYFPWLCEWQF